MRKKRVTLQPDSLGGRLQVFFEAHPDEELTTADIALKFDVPAKSVRPCLDRWPHLFERVGMRSEHMPDSKHRQVMNIWRRKA